MCYGIIDWNRIIITIIINKFLSNLEGDELQYRLIVMDLDETLLGKDFKISERNIKAIRNAREKGVKATIATGRMNKSSLPYVKQLNIDIPVITYHGALIRSINPEKMLYHYPVDYEMALPVVEAAEKMGYHINMYIDDQVHVREENHFTRLYQTIASVEVKPVGDMNKFLQRVKVNPTKLTIIDYEGKLDRMESFLSEKYDKQLTVTKSHRYFLEVTHLQATKGKALKFLADMLEIKPEEIIAMGDSFNDIDMLRYAGLGVAVANAHPEVKKEADLIAKSNLEDGVADIIEKYVI